MTDIQQHAQFHNKLFPKCALYLQVTDKIRNDFVEDQLDQNTTYYIQNGCFFFFFFFVIDLANA